ncbi:GPW/gp25 family protein [uncultured Croceicoccus sp.]|uniref:GPW/gp25 family protein n=1 Tax=uncultured Croceicoccus sp. TaxID=1295329 RepID=UPI002604E305|nr:GPW/gp25 family protein [uncultured Croceicoccus sp.]
MTGLDAGTGRAIDGVEWLAQAAADVLFTPIGTRVMRRDYGSAVPSLLDQPLNEATALHLYAATADALRRWLPQLTLTRCHLELGEAGKAALVIEGRRADVPQPNSFTRLTLPLPRLN